MKLSPEEVDDLLNDGLVEPPADFTQRVMQRIDDEKKQEVINPLQPVVAYWLTSTLRYLALLAGAGFGLTQFARLMFGVWVVGATN